LGTQFDIATQTPSTQDWPAAHLALSSCQPEPSDLQTLHPETEFAVQLSTATHLPAEQALPEAHAPQSSVPPQLLPVLPHSTPAAPQVVHDAE
jgi:hypothetical protein